MTIGMLASAHVAARVRRLAAAWARLDAIGVDPWSEATASEPPQSDIAAIAVPALIVAALGALAALGCLGTGGLL